MLGVWLNTLQIKITFMDGAHHVIRNLIIGFLLVLVPYLSIIEYVHTQDIVMRSSQINLPSQI